MGTGQRFTGGIGARAKVCKRHVSASGPLHLSRQFQKTPEKFEIPASDWPEKCFPGQGEEHLPGHFRIFLHEAVFTIDQRFHQIYLEFATFFIWDVCECALDSFGGSANFISSCFLAVSTLLL